MYYNSLSLPTATTGRPLRCVSAPSCTTLNAPTGEDYGK